MGPNRQKKPPAGGRYVTRRANFRQRQRDGTLKEPSSMLPKESRDMLIDVLHHVATNGSIDVDEKHFDPNNGKSVITFKKNNKLSSVEVAQLVFERLGYPPDVVAEYLVETVGSADFPQVTTVPEAVGSSSPHGQWFRDCCWDLFATMLWHAAANDNDDSAEAPVDDEEAQAEIEQVELVFGDNFIEERQCENDSDTYRDLLYHFPTAEGVQVAVVVRIEDYYPRDPPLVYIDVADAKNPAAITKVRPESFAMTAATRRELLDQAAAVIEASKGQCVLTMLIGTLQGAIAGLTSAKPPADKMKPADDQAQSAKKKETTEAKARFLKVLKDGPGEEDAQYAMPTKVELATVDKEEASAKNKRKGQRTSAPQRNNEVDKALSQEWEKLRETGSISADRRRLPAMLVREQFRTALSQHNVVVISGETGSGKTTQIPQYLYEFACEEGTASTCHVVCTQPRRLAATSVALRVADERDESIADTVGYSIRLENKVSARTRILFCTTGIVLRRLQSDPLLQGVSHVVVDEIHERGVDTDFLLILLRDLLEKRKDIKIVLMSATMDAELFSRYFNGAPLVSIGGRTFPVEVIPLERIIPQVNYVLDDTSPFATHEGRSSRKRNTNRHLTEIGYGMVDAADELTEEEGAAAFRSIADATTARTLSRMNLETINYEVIGSIVNHICATHRGTDGAILIFMPGLAEIQKCLDELRGDSRLRSDCIFFNLHSSLGSAEQREVFKRPPRGKRKVIIGTNIMETSITIDDAVFVIDSGKVKENRYDPRKSMSSLVTCWVSKANAKQRAGRAGRVRPGICYQLFTSLQHGALEDHQLCEMHRVPLESLILQIHTLNLGDEIAFLAKALSPPERRAVEASVKVLTSMGALTHDKRLTSLGFHLANLPIDVHVGKMMIHGALLSCLDPVLTIAACLAVRSPFMSSVEHQMQIQSIQKAFSQNYKSDQLSNWFAYQQWAATLLDPDQGRRGADAYCQKNFLSQHTLFQIQSMKQQYEWFLYEAGFLDSTVNDADRRRRSNRFMFEPLRTLDEKIAFEAGGARFNENSRDPKCIIACLVAGLYPNVAKVLPAKSGAPMRLATVDGSSVEVHPSSVVGGSDCVMRFPLVCYVDKIKTSRIFLREVSMISPFHVILFGASDSRYNENYQEMVVDNVVSFKCTAEDALLLRHIRDGFSGVLTAKINDPSVTWEKAANTVVRAILKLLQDEGSIAKSMVIVDKGDRKPLTAPLRSSKPAPPEPPNGQPFKTLKSCFNCGEVGHVTKYCPNPLPPKERGAATVRCFICGQWHHPADCTTAKK